MRARLVVIGLFLVSAALGARAGDEPLAWGADEVARVEGGTVSWADLCRAAADAAVPRLADPGSLEHRLLEGLVGDLFLTARLEAAGAEVTEAQVDARWERLDLQARALGGPGLEAGLRQRGVPVRMKRREIRRQLMVEALVAAGTPLEDVRQAFVHAPVETAAPWRAERPPVPLPPGVVARLDGRAVTEEALGEAVLGHVGPRQVHALLERACRIALAESLGARLDETSMRRELARLSGVATLDAQFDPEEVWEEMTLRGGRQSEARHDEAYVVHSPFAQSLFGVVKRFREAAHPEEVEAAWARASESTYGPHIEAVDVEIGFASRGNVFGGGPSRTRAEALGLARRIQAEHTQGAAFEDLTARLEAAGEEGIVVQRLRLYATDRARILLDAALALADGEVSDPVETLAEVHVLRRERLVPAPSFEAIEPLVRERLARERTRRFFEDRLADESHVRVRWPLPRLTD